MKNLKLIHRDIKPDNILKMKDGNYKIIDLGIAKDLSKKGVTMGYDKYKGIDTPLGTAGYKIDAEILKKDPEFYYF